MALKCQWFCENSVVSSVRLVRCFCEIEYQMISSKSKSSCAYAKTAKRKPGSTPTALFHPHDLTRPKDRKENIYDTLMNDLQADESSYIQKLLTKNQKKNPVLAPEDSSLQNMVPFCEKLNHQTEPSSVSNSHANTPRKNLVSQNQESPAIRLKAQRPLTATMRDEELDSQNKLQRRELQAQYLPCQLKSAQSNNFISDINHYLSEITHPHAFEQPRHSAQDQRSFRKTIELCNRQPQHSRTGTVHPAHYSTDMTKSGLSAAHNGISTAQYNALLEELDRAFEENEYLEAKLEKRQCAIEQMKEIIRSMYYETQHLKQELSQEKREKAKYSKCIDRFQAEIHRIKSSSKEKREECCYRNRSTHKAWQCEDRSSSSLRKSKMKGDEEKRRFNIDHLVREVNDSTLKKKGKLHRYKMSEDCFDKVRGQNQSTASIYKDCYYP